MRVKLEEVLSGAKQPHTGEYESNLTEGFVAPDTSEGFIRIYPDQHNKHRYAVVRGEDVVGELHKFTEAELAHGGFVGQERYHIRLKYGALVHMVTVSTFRAGVAGAASGHAASSCVGRDCIFNVDCASPCNKCTADTLTCKIE